LLGESTVPAVRRAATVALGLLGTAVEADRMLEDRRIEDPLDAAAVLLNAILSRPTSASRAAALLERTARPRAASLASTARIRCDLGRYLTAVG
jgi:hypothetical protein